VIVKKLFFACINGLAKLYIKIHNPYIIGITGSVWKTSCRMVVAQTLTTLLPDLRIETSSKNFNSIDAWFALSIFAITTFTPTFFGSLQALCRVVWRFFQSKRYEVIVLEYGIDQPGDMEALVRVARPDISIFTARDTVHAFQFTSKEEILFEKTRLLNAARDVVFVPSAGEYLSPYLTSLDADQLTYSQQEDLAHDADIGFVDYVLTYEQWHLYASCVLVQWRERIGKVVIPVLGKEQAGYASLGVAISLILAKRFQQPLLQEFEVQQGIGTRMLPLTLQEWRATVLAWVNESIIIDSTYNAAPESMKTMIDNTKYIRDTLFPQREFIICLWDMRELGQYSEEEHRVLARYVAPRVDRIYLVGEQMQKYFFDELKKIWFSSHRVNWYANSRLLGDDVHGYLLHSSLQAVILCKWSQNTIFLEEWVKSILQDQSAVQQLCRQSDRWMEKKEAYFSQCTSPHDT
jgi:UDP-N-acetylmuramyl pentapeptide synthase